jgi:hypothetical protein
MQTILTIAIIEACAKYGSDVVKAFFVALNKSEITLEDIEALRISKEPEEFTPSPE